MSSSPSFRERFTEPSVTVPYEDYAELLYTLLPSVRSICFYDHTSRVRWISDGVEVPEVTVQVTKALLQSTGLVRDSRTVRTEVGTLHAVIVRGPHDEVRGALAVVLERRKFGKKMRRLRPQAAEAILAPLSRILGREAGQWAALPVVPQPALTQPAPGRIQQDPFVGTAARLMSVPVILRRTISTAVNACSCAFGALVVAEQQLTVVQRGTDQQQVQAELRQIVESVREPITALMHLRNEPLVIAKSEPSWQGIGDYKLVACPLRQANGQLVALLVLLRHCTERDFDSAECASLREVAKEIPVHVLEGLKPLPAANPSQVSATPLQLEPTSGAHPFPSRTEQSLERRLRMALRHDGFDLHAQSLTPLRRSSDTARYEVLLRLRAQDGPQKAQAFMETAQQANLLPEIDRWVVGRLLNAIRPHNDALRAGQLEFALNVSAASLQRESFGDFIEAQLFRSDVPAHALVFEFAEHDVLTYLSMFERLAPRLTALGCRVALDNCRQGLDIFLSVGRLAVHRLKIDATLTQHITTDARAAHVVRELVEVARDIGIETVGECIEDDATRLMVRELGVDFAQGFGIAPPLPLVELLQ